MSSGGSKGSAVAQPVGTQTIQQKSEPWEGQKPYLQQGYAGAQSLLSGGAQYYYPNATYVPQSFQTRDALAAVENRARSGSPVQRAGNTGMMDTIGGKYLDPSTNPWLKSTYEAAADPMTRAYRDTVLPGVDADFIKAGRYGSESYRKQRANTESELARGLGNLGTQIYGGNYQAERGRQQEAIGQAPAYAAQDYNDAAKLGAVGQSQEGYAQQQLQDTINRYNFNQAEPWTRYGNYMSLIGGDYGRTSTTTQPIYGSQSSGNTFGNILGGLGTAASLAGAIGGFFRKGGLVTRRKMTGGAPDMPMHMGA